VNPKQEKHSLETEINQKASALVVSGFLGAGKTTLVRHLLEEAQANGIRMAVISNEFGKLGIDQALLGEQSEKNYVELEGGCVCCKLSDELVTSLQDLWENVRPQRVIVETSGVALPFDTLMNFWRDPVSQWIDDSVAVVMVNAEQVFERWDLTGTFEQQVSSADILLLNKVDRVPQDALSEIEAALDQMAPGTPIIRTEKSQVSTSVLFPPDPEGVRSHRAQSQQNGTPHHHEAFESEYLSIESGKNVQELQEIFLNQKAIRIKGFVETTEGLRLVQGIGPRVDLVPPSHPPPDHLIGQVVVIRRSDVPTISHD